MVHCSHMGGNTSNLVKRNEFREGELVISKLKNEFHWPAQVCRVDEEVDLKQRRYIVRHFVTGKNEFLSTKHLFPYKQNRKIKEIYKNWFNYVKAWEKIEEEFVSRYPESDCCACDCCE